MSGKAENKKLHSTIKELAPKKQTKVLRHNVNDSIWSFWSRLLAKSYDKSL